MKCKKSIMGLAALLILVFHFYIPFGSSAVEIFLWRSAYIGVDLFFFVSAYSLGRKDNIRFWSFLGNRLNYIYLPFVIMAIIAMLYNSWEFSRFLKVLTGIEFYQRGGGAFLWFVTAIMFFYLCAPALVKLKKRFGLLALAMLMAAWAVIAVVFQYVLEVETIFIMINRMPIFFIGFFYDDIKKLSPKKFRLLIACLIYAVGCLLVYKWGTTVRLLKPFQDMYYILAIPMVVGIVEFFEALASRVSIKNVPLAFLGRFTLELYGLQMIFGYAIEMKLYKQLRNGFLAFLITAIILVALAFIFNLTMKLIRKLLVKFKEKIFDEKISN